MEEPRAKSKRSKKDVGESKPDPSRSGPSGEDQPFINIEPQEKKEVQPAPTIIKVLPREMILEAPKEVVKEEPKVEVGEKRKAPPPKLTNRDIITLTLDSFKKKLANIDYLKNTKLYEKLSGLSVNDAMDWICWIISEGKTLENGIVDILRMYDLDVKNLKPEDFEMFRRHFDVLVELAKIKY